MKYIKLFEGKKVLHQSHNGYSYIHKKISFIVWKSSYDSKSQAKQRAEEYIDEIQNKISENTSATGGNAGAITGGEVYSMGTSLASNGSSPTATGDLIETGIDTGIIKEPFNKNEFKKKKKKNKHIKTINELFNSSVDINWFEHNAKIIQGKFEIRGISYGILSKKIFSPSFWKKGLKNAWGFKFYLDSPDGKFYDHTGYGDHFAVLSSVLKAFDEIVTVNKPDIIVWRVPKNETAKISLFNKIAPNMSKKHGFSLDIIELKVKGHYHLMTQWTLYKNENDLEILREINKKGK